MNLPQSKLLEEIRRTEHFLIKLSIMDKEKDTFGTWLYENKKPIAFITNSEIDMMIENIKSLRK